MGVMRAHDDSGVAVSMREADFMKKPALGGSKRFLTLMTLDVGSCDANMGTTVSVRVG